MTVKDGILPLPLDGNPILGLSFIQLNKVLFTVLTKFIGVVSRFAHNDWSETEAISGIGFTVIKKVSELPVQVTPLLVKEGVAIIVAVCGDEPVLVAVKEEILPLPLAANPMVVLSLVQLNTVFVTELVKFIAVV